MSEVLTNIDALSNQTVLKLRRAKVRGIIMRQKQSDFLAYKKNASVRLLVELVNANKSIWSHARCELSSLVRETIISHKLD